MATRRGRHSARCLLSLTLLGLLCSLHPLSAQHSQDVSIEDALRAKDGESDQLDSPLHSNINHEKEEEEDFWEDDAKFDEEEDEDDGEEVVDKGDEEEDEDDGEEVVDKGDEEEQEKETTKKVKAKEKTTKEKTTKDALTEEEEEEALADALDESLPDVIIDVPQKQPKFAKVVEIDMNATRKRVHKGDYFHPFHRPNIVDDVMYTYRRFRKMKLIRHGKFWMGTNDPRSETGEYPIRQIPVRSFYLDIYPVINAFYWAFRAKKRFARSEAEVKGWSWVSEHVVSAETKAKYSTEGPRGWLAVKRARWDTPEGPDSDLEDRWTHPVVHLSWHDAKLFCEFHGKRLPTEQEWEYAARSGLVAEEYPWGDRWQKRRSNTWQGKWPYRNSEADGYKATSPVDAFPPQNSYELYDMIGNVWEWTHSRYFERLISRDLQDQMHVLKGGSFVDSVDAMANLAVRNGQRSGQSPDYTASNIGFRCARSAPEVDPQFAAKRVKPHKVKVDPTKRRVPKIYRRPPPDKDEL